jgi:hypothetical protein
MKFEIGDKIIVLHSNEEGEVVEIINDKMVMVDVRGVKFPAYTDQIDFPYFKRFSEKKISPPSRTTKYIDDVKKEKKQDSNRIIDGVWLSFLPVMETDEFGDDVIKELKIHLINRTESAYQFVYRLYFFGKTEFELKNTVHSFENFYLHDILFEDLSDSPSFGFEFTLEHPDKSKADFFETAVKLRPKQVFEKMEEIRKNNNANFSYRLFEIYPDKIAEDKMGIESPASKGYKTYEASKAKQYMEPARSVVDLHIEKLTVDWRHLTNFEILTLQLKQFEKYYELAIAHLQPSLIVIHGVGTGKLWDEIHELLKHRKEVKTFVNQYDPRFGYGATEIMFQY